jgi:hypothetical protein
LNTKTLLEGSDTESFEEVSESDLQELAAHKSALSNASDTLTTVSLTSLQSKPEADQTVENNDRECALPQMSSVFFPFLKILMQNLVILSDMIEDQNKDSTFLYILIIQEKTKGLFEASCKFY